MKREFIPYGKTPQLRDVVREITNHSRFEGIGEDGKPFYNSNELPKILFTGTVKAHGTNAGIIKNKEGLVYFQSRNRIITPESDNMGFAQAMTNHIEEFMDGFPKGHQVKIFGEWCGPNVQKGVALSELKEKIFIIFHLEVDGELWHLDVIKNFLPKNVYLISQFPVYEVEIDFEKPTLSQNIIIEQTLAVERECPIGLHFGISGIGEGIVYQGYHDGVHYKFKSKGEKHSSSKVSTLAQVDPEKVKGVEEFIEYACTENRLNQGLEHISLDVKNTGEYIKWVLGDIVTEELDVLKHSGLEVKDIAKAISITAKRFFFKKLNK